MTAISLFVEYQLELCLRKHIESFKRLQVLNKR
jgi:hypothetical protein